MLNFLHDTKVVPIETAAAAGQSLLTTDVIDTQGFDGVAFIAYLGDVSNGSVLALTGFQNAEDTTDGGTELAASVSFTAGASDADDKLLVLDLHKPRERYVYATLGRGTANAAVNGIVAVLYGPHEKPVEQHADVIASTFVNDPAPAA